LFSYLLLLLKKLNPEYVRATQGGGSGGSYNSQQSTISQPLAVVSSMNDVFSASEAQQTAIGTQMQLADSTVASMEIMQDQEFVSNLQANGGTEIDGGEFLDQLSEYFTQYEVPVGMINKLMALQLYRLDFIIDDSGSMNGLSDVSMAEATRFLFPGAAAHYDKHQRMTRWQEAENRLHILIDILSFIPVPCLEIHFLNASNVISLPRVGKDPGVFQREAHEVIHRTFATIDVKYKTPTHRVLSTAIQQAGLHPEPTIIYFFTDGVPSDASTDTVAQLLIHRPNPQHSAITLISCSDNDDEVDWMKEVEEIAPFCSEIDDFKTEKEEVIYDQGSAFPYTKGFWLISQLVAAINPDDLDAMDENLPFTKNTLDNMLGRIHTYQEYQYYFERNPHAPIYLDVYPRFMTENGFARRIISKAEQLKREQGAGYRNGKRPSSSFASRPIGQLLTPHTEAMLRGGVVATPQMDPSSSYPVASASPIQVQTATPVPSQQPASSSWSAFNLFKS
jgi:hypothetical protein